MLCVQRGAARAGELGRHNYRLYSAQIAYSYSRLSILLAFFDDKSVCATQRVAHEFIINR
jgi:hypothetical protein